MLVKVYHGSSEKRPLLREGAFVSTMLSRAAKYARYPNNGKGTHSGYIFELHVDDSEVEWDDRDDCIQGKLKKDIMAAKWAASNHPLDLSQRESPVRIKPDNSCIWANGDAIEWQVLKLTDPQTVPTDILVAVAREQIESEELDQAILRELQLRFNYDGAPPQDRAAIRSFDTEVYRPRFTYTMLPPGVIRVPGAKRGSIPVYYRKEGRRILTNMDADPIVERPVIVKNEAKVDEVEGDSNQENITSSEPDIGGLSPFKVFTVALSHVPGLKILFGVVAVLAIIAIVKVWSLNQGWTIICGLIVIFFAFVLLILARFSASKTSEFRAPARVLMWFSVVLFIVWGSLLTSCVFFDRPIKVSRLSFFQVDKIDSSHPSNTSSHQQSPMISDQPSNPSPMISEQPSNLPPMTVALPGETLTRLEGAAPITTYGATKGDSVATMANKFEVSIEALMLANPGLDPKKLKIGQQIVIPSFEVTYAVKSGDTMTTIAKHFKVTTRDIQLANGIETTAIKVGQILKIPANTEGPTDTSETQ